MNATSHITLLTKWNSKQVFRQDMVKGHGYLIRSALKRADTLKSVIGKINVYLNKYRNEKAYNKR